MLKKILRYTVIILPIMVILNSCSNSKQLPYFKDISDATPVSKIKTSKYAPLKLQTEDEVQITISSTSPEASQFFNPVVVNPTAVADISTTSSTQNIQTNGYINLYRVSSDGSITMPVLGNIPAGGFTTEELKAHISEKLKEYLKDAIVTVRLTNFKITVMGEVGNPKVIPVNGQTINVLEAVGAAQDMTMYGIRRNVKVIRKLPDGSTEVALLNFNRSDVMQSPFFQLKQNDIIYVQPNKSKGILGTGLPILVPILTSLAYVAAIIITRK
jgi:polysaccharide export outer membrane protein